MRIIFPLALWGIGWALFNAPNQSSILGAVSQEKIGAAAGMIATTARTGGAMGVALSATLFGYLLVRRGSEQRSNRLARKLARRAGNLYALLQLDDLRPEFLHLAGDILFRDPRQETGRLKLFAGACFHALKTAPSP